MNGMACVKILDKFRVSGIRFAGIGASNYDIRARSFIVIALA